MLGCTTLAATFARREFTSFLQASFAPAVLAIMVLVMTSVVMIALVTIALATIALVTIALVTIALVPMIAVLKSFTAALSLKFMSMRRQEIEIDLYRITTRILYMTALEIPRLIEIIHSSGLR